VVGAAVCRELTLQGYACLLLERSPHLASGASSGNTGIACTASDVEEGTVEHSCLVEGTSLNLETYKALNIPHRASGTVYCAYSTQEYAVLQKDFLRRLSRGDAVALLDAHEARGLAPSASQSLVGGLWVKGEVVVDPWLVPIAWARHAWENGAVIERGSEVVGASFDEVQRLWKLDVRHRSEAVRARVVVACGGLSGDQLESLVRPSPFSIKPRRGDYVLYENTGVGAEVGSVPLGSVPNATSRGVYVWRSVHGVLAVGPTAYEVDDRVVPPPPPADDVVDFLKQAASNSCSELANASIAGTYSGLRPGSELSDYRISLDQGRQWVTVGGIRSTGLTASLGIAKLVSRLCGESLVGQVSFKRETDVHWTPLPSVPSIVASFCERADGSVVFSDTPGFGAHYVTHPLTRIGFSRMSQHA